jgi:hypothetical protein
MKREDTNRVNMINATTGFCDANPAPTAGIPAWAAALAAVKAKMVLINSYNQVGGGTTTGVTIDTNLLRKTMTGMAFKCARGTLGYANSVNNNTLKALVNFSESELNKIVKEDVDDTCQGIHDAANDNAAAVLNYNVTATDITDLQAAIDIYRLASQNPRQAKITKAQANEQASNMVREGIRDLLAGQMDVMVDTLKLTNNEHWKAYRQAREIINLGSTSAKVRGTVTREDGAFLSNVTFTILETGTDSIVKSVITDAEGKFNASQLPPGDFDFKWELEGYMTEFEPNVHIGAGKEIKRKVVMHEGGGSITIEGDVAAGAIANIQVMGLEVVPQTIIRVTVTGSTLRFYAATGNMEPPEPQYLDILNGQIIQKTVVQFAAMVGFDNELEDFLNVQNNGATVGHYQLKFENLGS